MRASNVQKSVQGSVQQGGQGIGRWLAMLALALAVTIGQAAPPALTGHTFGVYYDGGNQPDGLGGGPGGTK